MTAGLQSPAESLEIAEQRAAHHGPTRQQIFLRWFELARIAEFSNDGEVLDDTWAKAIHAGPIAIAGHIEGRASARAEGGCW